VNLEKIKGWGIAAAVAYFLYLAAKNVFIPWAGFVDETAHEWYFSDAQNQKAVDYLKGRGYNAPQWKATLRATLQASPMFNAIDLISNAKDTVEDIRVSVLIDAGGTWQPWEIPVPMWGEVLAGKRFRESITLTEAREWFQAQVDAVMAEYVGGK
jgi:hypothetical protein